jgi:hypothetical protein
MAGGGVEEVYYVQPFAKEAEKGVQLLSVRCSVFSLTEDAENMFSLSLRELNQCANLSLQPLSLGNSETVQPQ